MSDNQNLVATLVDNEKLDLRIFVKTDNYTGASKRGFRFYLFEYLRYYEHSCKNARQRYCSDTIYMGWILDQWDRIGHFYASLECGHVTASTAMKRLNGFTDKNHFYRANRELGRVFKTEHICNTCQTKPYANEPGRVL